MRRTIAIVAAVLAALALAACGGSGGNATGSGGSETGAVTEGGILRVGSINYIDSFNPFHFIESQSYNAFIMLYPQLVQYDFENGEYVIVGDLADSWDTSADGKDWTFHLKSGAKWSDGQPLTAEDVAETVFWVASRPAHVNIGLISMMPVCQAPGPLQIRRD